jgi:hypothetical protein
LLTALAVLASVVLKIFSFLSPRMFGLLLHTQKREQQAAGQGVVRCARDKLPLAVLADLGNSVQELDQRASELLGARALGLEELVDCTLRLVFAVVLYNGNGHAQSRLPDWL